MKNFPFSYISDTLVGGLSFSVFENILLLCLLGGEVLHEGVIGVVDDVDRGWRDVEHQVVEVNVNPCPIYTYYINNYIINNDSIILV